MIFRTIQFLISCSTQYVHKSQIFNENILYCKNFCDILILNFPAILFSYIIYRYHFDSKKKESNEKLRHFYLLDYLLRKKL